MKHARNPDGSKISVERAEEILGVNLGYYAGYYDNETRIRVEKLFRCEHPVFGSIEKNGAPTPAQAFKAGADRMKEYQKKEQKVGR